MSWYIGLTPAAKEDLHSCVVASDAFGFSCRWWECSEVSDYTIARFAHRAPFRGHDKANDLDINPLGDALPFISDACRRCGGTLIVIFVDYVDHPREDYRNWSGVVSGCSRCNGVVTGTLSRHLRYCAAVVTRELAEALLATNLYIFELPGFFVVLNGDHAEIDEDIVEEVFAQKPGTISCVFGLDCDADFLAIGLDTLTEDRLIAVFEELVVSYDRDVLGRGEGEEEGSRV